MNDLLIVLHGFQVSSSCNLVVCDISYNFLLKGIFKQTIKSDKRNYRI